MGLLLGGIVVVAPIWWFFGVAAAVKAAVAVAIVMVVLSLITAISSAGDERKKEEARRQEAEAEAARAIVRAKWEARRQELLETAIRAWGEETALRLRAREVKLGDTEDMVRFAFGEPEAIDEKVLKTKTKRTFKYQALGGRGYAVKIHLDDGEVVGWEK